MDFTSVIPKIVSGFDINKGDIILVQLWGEDRDLPLLDRFAIEIGKRGGIPVKWQQSRDFLGKYFSEVPPENLDFPDAYFDAFKPAGTVIDILTHSPAPGSDLPKERYPKYGAYIRKLFGVAASKKYFIQVFVPTEENAEEAGIDFNTFQATLMAALDIDVQKIKDQCGFLAEKFKDRDRVEIHSGGGRIFSCRLKGRQWYRDDGTGAVPCGEVYISPLEESGQGQLLVPEVYIGGRKFQDVLLTFRDGKLVETSDPAILKQITAFPGDCDRLAEFGIGFNPGVTKLTGYVPTDEKMAGTVHVAVGMNNLAGGKNDSPFHLDFVVRPERVELDGKTIMARGEFSNDIRDRMK